MAPGNTKVIIGQKHTARKAHRTRNVFARSALILPSVDLGNSRLRLGGAAVSSDWDELPATRMDLRSA